MTTTRAEPQPADFADVRTTNLAVVLRHLRAHGPSSRAAIAASTGLTKATVSSLTADLIDHRLLRESGPSGNRIGRPATVLALDGSAYASIGLQIFAGQVTALAVDYSGDQLLLWHRALSAKRPTSEIISLAQRAASRVRQQGRHVLGLTVALPNTFPRTGLREQVSGSLRQKDLVVSVAEHAALAAVAEQRHGGHAGADLAYVSGAAGLEAGLIIDGHLLRGGRLGRFKLGPAGTPTLEDQAGIEPLLRRALPDFDPEALADAGPAVEQVAIRARVGDTVTLAALKHTGGYLGQGLAVLTDLVGPEVIVLGDHFATLAPWLIPALNLSGPPVTASTLGLHAAALGGALSHLDQVDTGRIPRPVG
ncbi:ROK family transcriptional regulator [Actinoplanes regularis]|uniref:Sugar kinase of the NBD/HSP70 family, may contain an N-terminal HTH domain n=1 Tax=Actinoplanes regularis TaxID=52697 RepID=A0A239BGE0_9ACTN|nr:ROK family transcriptional regulator [Actinoplanes regularis]GIE87984.1 xylose repressor [Actinoplanes regularis]SNS06809.1 Sugar kinase of the NBD/HSP70 family, may contain an N-terminal HTH domain [Actinoplanes regularis]